MLTSSLSDHLKKDIFTGFLHSPEKMSFFKVMSGTLQKDALLKNLSTGQTEKIARIYCMRGKKQIEVDSLPCGDLGMTAKLANTNTNDTLSAAESALPYKKIKYPESFMQMSIELRKIMKD